MKSEEKELVDGIHSQHWDSLHAHSVDNNIVDALEQDCYWD